MGGGKYPYHTHCGNAVKAFSIGDTRIKICDDFCRDVSKAEVEAQLNKISQRIMMEFDWDNETNTFKQKIIDTYPRND